MEKTSDTRIFKRRIRHLHSQARRENTRNSEFYEKLYILEWYPLLKLVQKMAFDVNRSGSLPFYEK